ncbi:MAG: single-stranded DNA-binding protein [Rickettsiales bacterium]|nr:single-stranded DNA-binding protein [Rickettsiales bacterium]
MELQHISRRLSDAVDQLRFGAPVATVYNPLVYARSLHEDYLQRFGTGQPEVILLGMNPGPWGMAQTGVPFGEVDAVSRWMGLKGEVCRPHREHPKRPVQGLSCPRSEVSGRRLWSWAEQRYGSAENFFVRFFAANYCPLSFMESGGRNRTPDKLPRAERDPLFAACDRALVETVELLRPQWVVGIGAFAENCARRVLARHEVRIGRILHPSPASPIANRGWAERAEQDFYNLGIEL